MIRVLIVDDTKIICRGIEAILQQDGEIESVGMIHDGREAIKVCRNTKPDVVLMDIRMAKYDGEYAIQGIKQECPEIKVLIWSTLEDGEMVERVLASGIDGYILKESAGETIINSIKGIYYGLIVLDNTIFKKVKNSIGYFENRIFDKQNITEREYKMMSYIANGYNNKEVAVEMNLAEGTVRNNISKLLQKLKLRDRTQLAVYAVKNGRD